MEFIDTHCHLDLLQKDISEVVNSALENNVKIMVLPGTDLATSKLAIKFAEKYDSVFAAVGIHPHEVSECSESDIEEIADLVYHPKVVAIGEIGLDYHYLPFDESRQKSILKKMLALSSSSKKPIILHSRDALADLVEVIDEWLISFPKVFAQQNPSFGVFHMFEGDASSAKVLIQKGFQISFGGNITFKNNSRNVELLKSIGLSSLLLETDSPYMSPVPFRGIPNEPCRIPVIAAKIAEILQIKVELVAEVTTNNAKRLFSLR